MVKEKEDRWERDVMWQKFASDIDWMKTKHEGDIEELSKYSEDKISELSWKIVELQKSNESEGDMVIELKQKMQNMKSMEEYEAILKVKDWKEDTIRLLEKDIGEERDNFVRRMDLLKKEIWEKEWSVVEELINEQSKYWWSKEYYEKEVW